MGLYKVPLSMSLLGFGVGTMLANFHVCGIMLVLGAVCLGVVAILLLNVMDVFSVCGGALLDRPCMVFQSVCVLCL